jgi:hypothetical protein
VSDHTNGTRLVFVNTRNSEHSNRESNLFAQFTTMADAAALESATVDSVSGNIIHDVVDYIQERILKDRQSRSEEHWRILMVRT